jgi:GT2 family glycosyltransferase
VAYNDVDYCLKLGEAGLRVIFTPFAELYHHESASRGSDFLPHKSARLYSELLFMKRRWRAVLERDPWAMPGLPAHLSMRGWLDLQGVS